MTIIISTSALLAGIYLAQTYQLSNLNNEFSICINSYGKTINDDMSNSFTQAIYFVWCTFYSGWEILRQLVLTSRRNTGWFSWFP
jgi:hypothetical protein